MNHDSMLHSQTRDFFAAFFTLSDFHWHGFLSTRLSFPQLVGFGLALFLNASNNAKANLLKQGVPGERGNRVACDGVLLTLARWFSGLFKMLFELVPTLSSEYYPGLKPLKAIKAEADARSAAAGQGQGRAIPVAPPPPPSVRQPVPQPVGK